ncbi:MAG: hypothetical protein A2W61_05190 [Deltaproteobacteria bacterium RIFCSPLOWO2_01_44_7]|nr:MAG: hypothetical protein A2712_07655 [Deltaproteobacteria bacterium RIFCSPHIGHO2_01_FULL_43_49]OGQ14782.1 MAG: hypothetical protein A3D22_09340 [Deltaproteobacteria bacterium RIFCSPHIGHO2_02_FULL_44_53]OGQ28168.1 MAG: hypothetical protein A3D98_08050 [Deltaproteobacteria bacterium RIFCSPHIGHO2_12_FULL_44_21]OGQ31380.1 MAG: hypothetical protein A2979_08100 [Deltaproteobacteria bacterium RIFCSPLOWO2_01_FULL_45_74]OGQ39064.1 MAG: hypothetical protein A2W61_05190 [Deltaproteobacteria bacterium 
MTTLLQKERVLPLRVFVGAPNKTPQQTLWVTHSFCNLVQSLTSLIFPDRCVGCDIWGALLCASCYDRLHFLKVPAHLPHLSKQYFTDAYSVLAYESLAHDWIHQYKYHRKLYLAPLFISLLSKANLSWENYDSIVPVPLHWTRQVRRGFNPTYLLTNELGKKLGKPILPYLKKVRRTKPQTKLSQEERLKNVKGTFACNRHQDIKDLSLLLVDDVLTTGATVNECAKVLMKAGAKRVDVLTLARPL